MTVQGFWGLEIKPNKVYKQVVPSPFQLIMVALDHDNAFTTRSSLVVKVDERELILCSLSVGQVHGSSGSFCKCILLLL
ncbi:hypothetical protein J3Q64DRAFT_1767338 [Phycomyces blakesleeanus]|uniref:Nucleoplasmin-like domain-containing protein n=1 Tax=Phycomyces blakesleeanus TaxID=4837 RepID=A0ABR3AMF6_PHYBL